MSNSYDVPYEKQQILQDIAKRKLELRNQFLKQASDPFRHATGEGGTVFDPAIQRYQALKVTEYERFKPNATTAKFGFWYMIVPFAVSTYVLYRSRTANETKLRRGEVPYKERAFKFI